MNFRRIAVLVLLALGFVSVDEARAVTDPFALPVTVRQQTLAGGIGYSVQNDTYRRAIPFDIALLVVTHLPADAGGPTLDPALATDWLAVPLDAAAWELPMFIAPRFAIPSWHEYTGLLYREWDPTFPTDPVAPAVGYFLHYGMTGGGDIAVPTDPIRPGEALFGFLRQGSAGSIYLVAGPADGSQPFPVGAVETFSGEVSAADVSVPEPSSLVLLASGLAGVIASRWRRK